MKIVTRYLGILGCLSLILFSFQNCGEGLEVFSGEIASTSTDPDLEQEDDQPTPNPTQPPMATPSPTPPPLPGGNDILFADDAENYTSIADAVARGPWAGYEGNVSISRNYAKSGTQSYRVCYVANEAQAFVEIDLGAGVKHLFLRWWELREKAGDFPGAVDYDWAGEKFNRIRSRIIGTTGLDYPLGWGSAGANPFGGPGTTDGGEISLFGNSVAAQAPGGGGYVTSFNYNMPRGEWHLFEVEINLGTFGQANGEARIWVDNVLRAERRNVVLLPKNDASLEIIWMGGWYSGSGNPSGGPACRYFDDIVVSRSRIGG